MSREIAKQVLRVEAEAIQGLIERLDERFDRAVDLILKSRGRVIVSGMGKSGLVGKKIAATLASTGTPAYFLHPAEAVHGDLGMLVDGDVVLALSNSGETPELLRLLEFVKRLNLSIIAFVGQEGSALGKNADVALDCGIAREACPLGLAPTASTTAALAMGDALALTVASIRGFTAQDFASRHPGGSLGRKLFQVKDLMRTGDAVPRVRLEDSLVGVVSEMSRKGIGMTTVVDAQGCLAGIVTDGDLRRLLEKGVAPAGRTAADCRTPHPKTIAREETASKALALLEEWKITSLVVVDAAGHVEGVLHLHDLWRLELF